MGAILVSAAVVGIFVLFAVGVVAMFRQAAKAAAATKLALEEAGYRLVATLDDGRLGAATMLAGTHGATAGDAYEKESGSARFTLMTLREERRDSTHRTRCLLIQSSKLDLPRLTLFPRGGLGTMIGKLAEFALKTYAERHGLKRLECTELPALGELFLVAGQSESDVGGAFDARVVSALKTLNGAVTVDCSGGSVLLRAMISSTPVDQQTKQLLAATNVVYAAFSDVRPRTANAEGVAS